MSRLTQVVLINSRRYYLFIFRGLSEELLDIYKKEIEHAVRELGDTPGAVGVAGIMSSKAGGDYTETDYPLDGTYLVFFHSSGAIDDSGRPLPFNEARLDTDMVNVQQAYATYLDVAEENVAVIPVFGELPEIVVRAYV